MLHLNIEIAIPEEVNRTLEVLRAMRGITKKAIIAEALTYYARSMEGETTIGRQPSTVRDIHRRTQGTPGGPESPTGPTEGDLSK